MINSFGIEMTPPSGDSGAAAATRSDQAALSVSSVLKAAVPAIGNSNQDVKNAAIKIVLDV